MTEYIGMGYKLKSSLIKQRGCNSGREWVLTHETGLNVQGAFYQKGV